MNLLLYKNISARRFLDNFLVAAISSVLATRAFLFLTNFPQMGGDSLHIAHMLWGGFFMAAALIITLVFYGRHIKLTSAVLGGVGFGLFIDELGKFITHDNNYFFRPTIMLIYLIFVGLYFVFREIDKTYHQSHREQLVNALSLSQEAVMDRFDEDEKSKLKILLKDLSGSQLSLAIDNLVKSAIAQPIAKPWTIQILASRLYTKIVSSNFFLHWMFLIALAQGILFLLAFWQFASRPTLLPVEYFLVRFGLAILAILGIWFLGVAYIIKTNRLLGFRRLYRGNLFAVFVIQPIAFYVATFVPVLALALNLASIAMLQYAIKKEEIHQKSKD